MKDYNRARVYLDENYKSQEHFTVNFECKFWISLCSNNVLCLSICDTSLRAIPGDEVYMINLLQALIHGVVTRLSCYLKSLISFVHRADIEHRHSQHPSMVVGMAKPA